MPKENSVMAAERGKCLIIVHSYHHNNKELLDLADQLPEVSKKSCFIFSTSAIIGEAKVAKDHSALRQKLVSSGYLVKGEFSCKGFNTNSFLKFFGGMNKGRPNSEDLRNAAEFALNLE